MSSWRYGELGQFFETVTGNTPPKNKQHYYGAGVPLVKPPELLNGSIDAAQDSLTPEGAAVARILSPKSILVSCIGNLGKGGMNSIPVAFNQQINAIKPAPEMAAPEFMFYQVLSPIFTEQLEKLASGTTVPIVNKSKFNSIRVAIPPFPEQKRIVAILDEAFAGIETAIANTEKNLANARELFESYLNKVFSRHSDGWQDLTLKEVCLDYGRGKSKHRPRNDSILYGGKYPFIQTGDVRHSDHMIKTYSNTYNDKGLAQSKLWPRGTICITIAANIADTGVLDFDACFPDSIIGLVVDQKRASNAYVEFLLQSVKTVLKSKGKGSAQDNINLGTLEKERFPFPPLRIQKEIVENVQDLRVTVRRLEHNYQEKLTALAELKQSLLQKAFSGGLTAEVEKEIEEVAA